MRERTRAWTEEFSRLSTKQVRSLLKDFDRNGKAEMPLYYTERGVPHMVVGLFMREEGVIDYAVAFCRSGDDERQFLRGRLHYVRKPCRFGGSRILFLCPVTGMPCHVLYFWRGEWRSRQAAGLHYRTESAGVLDRMLEARDRLREQMRDLSGGKWYDKPAGRGAKKYGELFQRHEKLECALWGYGEKSVLKLAKANDVLIDAGFKQCASVRDSV